MDIDEAWVLYRDHERGDRIEEADIWWRILDLHDAAVAANLHGVLSTSRPLKFARHVA